MRKFVIERNIERYHRLLETETDGARRRSIMKLLAEEESIRAGVVDADESDVSTGEHRCGSR